MFLSALVSRYEGDGSFVVDLKDLDGPIVRYGPYAAGMPWHRQNAGEWVATAFDWEARLINRAHETRKELPVLRYLQAWPADLVESLHPIWYAQSSVMQICALYSAARDLARSNLVLLWLVGARYAEDAAWRACLPEALTLPQRDLLAAVLDQPTARPAQVRFLNKVTLTEGKGRTLNHLRNVVADEDTVMAFGHWPHLPSALVPLTTGVLLRRLGWLRDQMATSNNPWQIDRLLKDRIGLLIDTNRMLERLDRDGAASLVGMSCHDWMAVSRLHDVLVEFWTEEVAYEDESDLDPAQSFGLPPIPSSKQFEAITTVGELAEEGKTQRHCVSIRAPDVLDGSCYIYRVNVRGERGTLQIGTESNKRVIDEFRLRNNADPSPAAWIAAMQWVNEANSARMRKSR